MTILIYFTATSTSTPIPQQEPGSDLDIHLACFSGDLVRVRNILSQGQEDINGKAGNSLGKTPLMQAAHGGRKEVFDFLVSEGADISLLDNYGFNILHWACRGGSVEMVKYILSLNGMDVNTTGTDGTTPVASAAWMGHKDVVDFLVGEGADVTLVSDLDENILHWTCQGGNVEMVRYILSQKFVDINARTKIGQTAADIAEVWGHKKVVRLLKKPRCHVM